MGSADGEGRRVNYYERHLGDYARDTGHLSLLEHGVYTLLLDRCYATEQGIPEDQAYRLARARSEDERAAVDAVLSEFFTLEDGVWINARVLEEVERYRAKIEAARENGKKGGRPRKETQPKAKKTQPFPPGSEIETQPKAHQTPDTSNTQPNGCDAGASPKDEPDPIWGAGLAYLVRSRIPERQARSLIGKLRKQCGDVETGAILAQAETESVSDPAPWLMAAASRRSREGPGGNKPVGKQMQGVMALEEMKRERLAGSGDFGRTATAGLLVAGSNPGR